MASHRSQNFTPTSFTISGMSKEEAYTCISNQISLLEGQIRVLHSLRNTLSPVSSLPVELLSGVFMHCCDLNESGAYTDLRRIPLQVENDLDMRLVVSWVSHQWRRIALQHKPLWNLVLNTDGDIHADYVRACVARCHNLHIDLHSPEPEILQLCTPHFERVSYFKLGGDIDDDVIDSFDWPPSIPSLQSLVLGPGVPSDFLDGLTAGMCPSLHSLEFGEILFDWNFFAGVASNITNLTIIHPISRVTTKELVHLLKALHLLIRCEVSHCLNSKGESDVPASPLYHVSLPRLQNLVIFDVVEEVIKLVQVISAPAASIDMTVFQGSDPSVELGGLFRALQTNQGPLCRPIHHLKYDYQLTISSSSSSPPLIIGQVGVLPAFEEILLACDIMDLDNLQSLWTARGTLEIMEKFSRLNQLRKMTFDEWEPLEAFVAYLKETPHDPSAMLFPALQELILLRLDSEGSLDGLYDILSARKISGVPLQRLEFIECDDLKMKEVAYLKKVVGAVEISGKYWDE